MNIVLGVTGSIAAYKAADITSRLKKLGHNVDVILTENGSKIITALTLQTLSKNKVYMDMFEEITPTEVKHISLAEKADLVLIAPAMNTNMYENPIVQENIEKLKSLGYQFIEPKESMLACGTLGKGALADVDVIVDIVEGSMK